MVANNFADRLMAAIAEKNRRVCVGIDPVLDRIPQHLRPLARFVEQFWGPRAEGFRTTPVLAGVGKFCAGIIEAVAETVPVIKFNSAFFEALGPGGPELLYRLMAWSTRFDLLVLVDAKRGDVGSTAEAYASAMFGQYAEIAMRAPDAVTVSPWLGSDGVSPFIEQADELGRGVFVLVRTSNPSAAELQDLVTEDGTPMYRHVARLVSEWGEDLIGESGYSSVGAVVGATWPEQLAQLREAMPHTPFLVPGYGAQGGGAGDVVGAFDADGLGAIVSSSRGIIYASDGEDFAEAAAQAADNMRVEINGALGT